MKKIVFIILSSFIIFFLFFTPLNAQGDFQTDVRVEYRVEESGSTLVTHQITLTNLTTSFYASSYTFSLENVELKNVRAYENNQPLEILRKQEGEAAVFEIRFDKAIVGRGKSRTFTLTFENTHFAIRSGEVWEISIPRLANQDFFNTYTVVLSVPASFEQEAYVSPKPFDLKPEGGRLVYFFDKKSVAETGVTAGFGKFQIFSFTLNYHLENPLNKTASVDIAIPPDTALQKMHYQMIEPEPRDVYVDPDGNWLATFILKPREQVDIKVSGSVQIFAGPRPFPRPKEETLSKNLSETKHWQVTDPEINSLGKKLATARAIYNFVSQNLSYDYNRVKPNVTRLGAKEALKNPKNAICMEFTDLFISLARAAGIPAREVNGFAYTENPEIQPLSLVADVLHAWPEYWDAGRGAWIPVDPTWGSTTGGVDFFNKLDLRHFTFVNHGIDSEKPYPPGSYKLGPNPQKDVFVSFGQLPKDRGSEPQITLEFQKSFPFMPPRVLVSVKNGSASALYNADLYVYFDGKRESGETIEVLPPYSSYKKEVVIPYTFLGKNTPSQIEVKVLNKSVVSPTPKNRVIIENLLVLFILLSVVIILILIRLKKPKIAVFKDKIIKLIAGIFSKNEKKDSQLASRPDNKRGV